MNSRYHYGETVTRLSEGDGYAVHRTARGTYLLDVEKGNKRFTAFAVSDFDSAIAQLRAEFGNISQVDRVAEAVRNV